MPDYGYDMSGGVDLTPTLLDVEGDDLMRQVCLRRLYTPNKSLLSSPDEETCDLREFISTEQDLAASQLTTIRGAINAALMADSRIFSVTIELEWEPFAGLLTVALAGTGATGPFKLVLQASAATVTVLE